MHPKHKRLQKEAQPDMSQADSQPIGYNCIMAQPNMSQADSQLYYGTTILSS